MRKKKKKTTRTTAKKVQRLENLPPSLPPNAIPAAENDDEEDVDADGLTVRRRMFIEYLTGKALGNATKAARLAGYACDNQLSLNATAGRLLRNVGVKKAIARRFAQKFSPDDVRSAIVELAQANMGNFLSVGDDGQPTFDWKAAASAGAIGQVREYSEDGFDTSDGPTIIKRKFKIHDRLRALELLAKMNGQLVERRDITSNGETIKGYAVVSPDDWDGSDKPDAGTHINAPADADKGL